MRTFEVTGLTRRMMVEMNKMYVTGIGSMQSRLVFVPDSEQEQFTDWLEYRGLQYCLIEGVVHDRHIGAAVPGDKSDIARTS